MLEFLPEKLNLEGTFEEIVKSLYSIFERDIRSKSFTYKSLPVIFDNNKIDSEFEEGFWHVITRGREEREIDFNRAKRLPWLRPIVENTNHPEILLWVEQDTNRGKIINKTYIWYREGKYLIILKEIPRKYFLTTAFYVNGNRNDRYFYRKYQNALKKGPEC